MSKIRIKNFGPIKEGYHADGGFMDIKKVTALIGNQGSGKSTVAKVISTLTWLEKAINRGDVTISGLTKADFHELFEYQRIHNYFEDNSEIDYVGEKLSITYNRKLEHPEVVWNAGNYKVPKIMYVPAERNFLSVVKNAFGTKNLPDTLYTFAEELRKGQLELNSKLLHLPIGKIKYKYNKSNDTSYILGEGFELDLLESSSGYQSLVPLFLVTKFLSDELQKGENVLREQLNVEQSVRRNNEIAKVMFDDAYNDSQKDQKVKEIDAKYLNTCFINIVEEPEQNLFPTSQRKMLNCLLEFNNKNEGNKLIVTTHSPYLINYLTHSVKADSVLKKINSSNNVKELSEKLNDVVPLHSTVPADDWVVYELNENGTIKKLESYDGLPSDENYLNERIAEGNEIFGKLLDIEDLCQ